MMTELEKIGVIAELLTRLSQGSCVKTAVQAQIDAVGTGIRLKDKDLIESAAAALFNISYTVFGDKAPELDPEQLSKEVLS